MNKKSGKSRSSGLSKKENFHDKESEDEEPNHSDKSSETSSEDASDESDDSNDESEDSDKKATPPYSINLRYDIHLKLGNENFKKKISSFLKKIGPRNETELVDLENLSWPSTYELAQFSANSYENYETEGNSFENTLPRSWKLLTTASNNGYFGVAYWNPKKLQIVITHRGIKNSEDEPIQTHLEAMFNRFYSHVHSACTFAYEVIKVLEEFKNKTRFQLFFTGHSLGGWLAQITTFSVKYLVKGSDLRDVFLKIKNPDEGYHVHTEVFDSPGCHDILQNMVDDFDVRHEDKTLDLNHLDITNYVVSPNIVNCFSKQIGQVVLLLSNSVELSLFDQYYQIADSLELILNLLSDSSCNSREVLDWPVNDALPIGDECQTLFVPQFEWLNNADPNTKTKAFMYVQRQCQGYYPIRYQTKPLETSKCNINVFTISEQTFLRHFQWIRGVPEYFKPSRLLSKCFSAIEPQVILNELQSLEIQSEKVKCEPQCRLKQLIPFVKKLLEFNPGLKDEVKKALSVAEVRIFAYKNESYEYCKKMKKLVVNFSKTSGLSKKIKMKKFQKDKLRVCQVLTDSDTGVLTALIVKILSSNGLDNYLVTRLRNVLALNKSVSLKEVLMSNEFQQTLLVFDCNVDEEYEDEAEELLKEIIQAINNTNSKFKGILIIISNNDSNLSTSLEKYIRKKVQLSKILEYEGVKWSDLSTDSQEQLVGKELLTFQGSMERVSLKTVLKDANITEELMDDEIIIALLKNRDLIMGNQVPDLGEISNYYVPRAFQLHFHIKADILFDYQNSADIIAIGDELDSVTASLELFFGVKPENVQLCLNDYDIDRSRIFVLTNENDSDCFESLIKKAGTRNVHWLTISFNVLIWKTTHGCPKYVERFLDNDEGAPEVFRSLYLNGNAGKRCNYEWNENEIPNIANNLKYLVISDTAGMGKSTVLTNLARKMKLSNPNLWVVRINLNDCTKPLKNMSVNFSSKQFGEPRVANAVKFLDKMMNCNSNTSLRTTFEKNVFKKKLLEVGDVALLFDAFDEISPNYEAVFEELLNVLKETKIRNIFVTTRPFEREEVESELNTYSFVMRPFSKEDRIQFLVNFWCNNGNEKTTEELCYKAKRLVDAFTNCIFDDKTEFVGVPLQCRLLAEVYLDSDLDDTPNNISLVGLYEAFETKKLEIYQKEKCPSTDGSINLEDSEILALTQLREFHRHLALGIEKELFDSVLFQKGSFEPEIEKILAKKALKVGLVLKFGPYPKFVHQTFQEFFLANYFANALEKPDVPDYIVHAIMSVILIAIRFNVVRSLFNGSLNSLKSYRLAVDNFSAALSKIYLNNINSWISEWTQNSAFHTAIQYNLKCVFKFLVDCCLFESRAETLVYLVNIFNMGFETPTVYALKINNTDSLELVKYLVEKIKMSSEKVQRTYLLGNIMNRKCQQRFMDYIETDQVLGPKALKIRERSFLINELYDAAERGHKGDLSKILQEAGDDDTRHFLMLAFNESIYSALNIAVFNGRFEATRLLMDQVPSAIPFLFSKPYYSLLEGAVYSDSLETFKLVAEKIPPDSHMLSDWSTMAEIIDNKQEEMFSLLLDKGLDTTTVVELVDAFESLLGYAVRTGSVKIVESILKRGVDVNKHHSIGGGTVLHRSVFANHPGTVILLLQNGANLKAIDDRGDTPLHEAGVNTPGILPRIVSAFIEYGAELDALNAHKETPFDVAISWDNTGALVALIPEQRIVTSLDSKTRNYLWRQSLRAKLSEEDFNRLGVELNKTDDCDPNLYEQFTTHDIYFDYFAAEFLTHKLQRIESPDNSLVQFMVDILVKEEYETMKLFFNQILKRNQYEKETLRSVGDLLNQLIESILDPEMNVSLHRIVDGYHENILRFLLNCLNGTTNFVRLMTSLDNTSRTALSRAMDAEYFELVNIMVRSLEHCSYSQKKIILEATLYQDSVILKRLESLIELMENYTFLQDVCSEFKQTLELLVKFKDACRSGNLKEVKAIFNDACTKYERVLFSIEETRDFCKINFYQRTCYTTLNLAVDNNHVDVVKFLIEAGFSLNPPYSDEKYDYLGYDFYERKIIIPPVYNAVKSGNINILKLLIDMGADVNAYYSFWTLLKVAVYYKDIDIIEFLLRFKKNIEGLDDSLILASERGYAVILRELLIAGANVNHKDPSEYAPLHCIASYADENAVSFLLERGADVNAKHLRGGTPLHIAAEKSNVQVVRLLLDHGGEVNAANCNGDTPLHLAVSENCLNVVSCLVERGADRKLVNEHNKSPFDIAKENQRSILFPLLE